ncbi:MAG: 5'-methylthioadenosine/S-adenosylhomocysteine nucleosidase [Clostridia bacterium]|nr:5'-methylthioadenosine/S-adenosylhomocysteine nucleosidase [Clostridia bacterium]
MPKPIAVLCPMDCEYEYLAARLQNAAETAVGDYRFQSGTVNGYPVTVIRCLIGAVNAAAAAVVAMERLHPCCMILQGTAGGHHPKIRQNDIVLGENIVEYASYVTPRRASGEGISVLDWQYIGAQTVTDGKLTRTAVFHSDGRLLQAAMAVPYKHGVLKRGTMVSGDMWNRELDRIAFLHERLHSDCEEMESAAVAQVCKQFSLPMLAVRVISNNELYPDQPFRKSAAEYGQKFCFDLLDAWTKNPGNLLDKL